MGFIREKEGKWAEASGNYEHAWKLSKRRNPTIGSPPSLCPYLC